MLEAEYHINVKRHSKYPNLVLLKYNMLSTPMNSTTRECRGIILDEANDWQVVNYTYKRFVNLGETWGDTVDFSTAKVYDKVDGSLAQLYYYDGNWNMATSGMPDALGQVDDHGFSFADLFWRVWGDLHYQLPANTNLCFALELCSRFNQLVVHQATERIVLHGVRDLITLDELEPEPIAAQYGWECVKSFPFATIEDVVAASKQLKYQEAEGYVVRDASFNRVKIKSPEHVLHSHLRDSLSSSQRNIIEFIRKGESSELLAYMPALKTEHDALKAKYEALITTIEATYQGIQNIQNQKDYAAEALKHHYSSALFAARKGIMAREFLLGLAVKSLEEWLNR